MNILVGDFEVSISRRIMKDSQLRERLTARGDKYIKANNERFSTGRVQIVHWR